MRVAPPFTRLSLKGKHFSKSTGNEAGQFGQTISGYYYQ